MCCTAAFTVLYSMCLRVLHQYRIIACPSVSYHCMCIVSLHVPILHSLRVNIVGVPNTSLPSTVLYRLCFRDLLLYLRMCRYFTLCDRTLGRKSGGLILAGCSLGCQIQSQHSKAKQSNSKAKQSNANRSKSNQCKVTQSKAN